MSPAWDGRSPLVRANTAPSCSPWFAAALAEIAEIERRRDAISASLPQDAYKEIEERDQPLFDRKWAIIAEISAQPPQALGDVLAKLDAMADPDTGIDAGAGDSDGISLRQCVAWLRTMVGGCLASGGGS